VPETATTTAHAMISLRRNIDVRVVWSLILVLLGERLRAFVSRR
jgi:hypothetical protein